MRVERLFAMFVVALLLVVVLSPLLALIAIAVAISSRGPVLYRSMRPGIGGESFACLKFRTMRSGADQMQADLVDKNQRDGVLFKLSDDPRVTKIGKLLRATSLDELPQLINVVRGDMSVVGPRPAQASEVAAFDEQLLARLTVLPGITGLWQVEARDSSSFQAYQRLDLFYVENWSVSLDLAILLSTVQTVGARGIRAFRKRTAPAAETASVSWLLD
jgi:lipopolysaccharide/colanic/teichoic acid biosynthesis glycosyltransferase